jgi:hypothetical protein
MLGRRELVAAAVAALMAGLAVVVLAGLDDGEVVEIRVQGGVPPVPELGIIHETSSTIARAAAHSGRVVWAEKGDIWLYDAKTDKRSALTTDGTARHDFKPRFRDRFRVTYLTSHEEFGPDPTLVEFDLTSGQRRELQQLPGYIRAYDWNPDGVTLAYYNVLPGNGKTELHIRSG